MYYYMHTFQNKLVSVILFKVFFPATIVKDPWCIIEKVYFKVSNQEGLGLVNPPTFFLWFLDFFVNSSIKIEQIVLLSEWLFVIQISMLVFFIIFMHVCRCQQRLWGMQQNTFSLMCSCVYLCEFVWMGVHVCVVVSTF